MAMSRVTQNMMVDRSVEAMQRGLERLSAVQQQLSTGKRLNRPSDSPTDTTSAMRLRSSLKAVDQYARNAEDGQSRLGLIDQTLFTVTDEVSRAREIALQGANTGSMDQASRDALGTYVGVAGPLNRRVGDNVTVRVDVDGPSVFGDGPTSVFAELDALSTALRTGSTAGIQASIGALSARQVTVSTVHADVGATYKRIEQAQSALVSKQLQLTSSLSDVEEVDLAKGTVELSLHQVAYQAALASTAKVIQPSLMDFLR
jgi:flagellar hook-associated protein 3 FlgL